MLLQILIGGMVTGLLYALVALGFSLIYSGTRIFHLAHGAIYTSAAYFYLLWSSLIGLLLPSGGWLASGLALAVTCAAVCVLAIGCESLVYHPLYVKQAPPLVNFISSMGIYIVIVNLIALLFGNQTRPLGEGIKESLTWGTIVITRNQLTQFAVSLFALGATFAFLRATSLGRNIRALSDNPPLLSVLGVSPDRVRLAVILLGSMLAALASLLKAVEIGIDPAAGFQPVLVATVAMIIGGIGSLGGTVWSALFLGVIQNAVVWALSARWQYAATFVVLLLFLAVRREGLFAARLRMEER